MAVEILTENQGKLDCHACDEKLREERGHDKEGTVTFWVEGKPVRRCPLTIITPLSYEYIKAFGFYEKSILPNGIGWINESNKYIQAMSVIGNEFKKQSIQQDKKSVKRKYGRN